MFSGPGSRDPEIVLPYIEAIEKYFEFTPLGLTAVDVGCGDFSVGSKICKNFSRYIAIDVASNVIEQNRSRHGQSGAEFICMDACGDQPLPECDIVFLRQVLQHLSNSQISSCLKNLRCKTLVLTEHLPLGKFTPNVDKPSDDAANAAAIRLYTGSGVVLELPPFNLDSEGYVICEVEQQGGVIRTSVYEL